MTSYVFLKENVRAGLCVLNRRKEMRETARPFFFFMLPSVFFFLEPSMVVS